MFLTREMLVRSQERGLGLGLIGETFLVWVAILLLILLRLLDWLYSSFLSSVSIFLSRSASCSLSNDNSILRSEFSSSILSVLEASDCDSRP